MGAIGQSVKLKGKRWRAKGAKTGLGGRKIKHSKTGLNAGIRLACAVIAAGFTHYHII